MKRIISMLLIMFVFMSCVIVPVFADENSTGNWIELLDYGTVNASGTNVFGITGSKTISLAFPTGSKSVGHVNVLLYSSQVISDAYVKDSDGTVHSFNVYSIGQGLYRVFGDLNQYIYTSLNLTLETSSSNTAYCELLSCRITTVIFNRKQVPAHAYGTIYKSQVLYPTLTYPSTDPLNWTVWTYDNMDDYEYQGWNGAFQFNLYLDDWEEYDFIDIEITGQWANLNSIRTELDNLAIPYEASNVYSVDGVRSGVFITLDLRNVDRRYTGQPIVTITGSGYYNPSLPDVNANMFSIDGIYGYIQENDPEPLGYWMRYIKQHLTSLFNNLGTSITSLGSNINSWISAQTSSIQAALGVMRENLVSGIGGYISDFSTNVNNWISAQTTSINYVLNGIGSSITSLGTNIGTWFTTQTSELQVAMGVMRQNIGTYITTQTNSLISAITSGVDRIVSALSPENNSSEFNDKLNDSLGQLGEAGAAMGSLTRPDMNQIDFNVTAMVPQSGLTFMASLMNTVYSNDLLGPLILLYCTLGLASFLIFGKR